MRELLAYPEGFEPPTPRFEAWCSIQLSYGYALFSYGLLKEMVHDVTTNSTIMVVLLLS